MSLSETTARKDYVGNASTTAFAYTWRITDKSHLEVLVDGVVQTVDTDYTVSGVDAAAGGSVTFTTPPADQTVVTLLRKQPLSQLSDYVLNEAHPSDRIEKDLDKVVMALQQDRETLGRALKFGKASLHKDQDIPEPSGVVQLLAFDGTKQLVLVALSSAGLTGVENPMSAAGDLIVGGTAGAPARLATGAAGALLTVVDGVPAWEGAGGGRLGQSLTEHLVVENLAAAPLGTVVVTADRLSVEGVVLTDVLEAAVVATSGAGGLDTGAEAADTWYAIYVITDDTGAQVAALLSTSFTAPTLPSGYTRKRRVSAVRNDGSSNFLAFAQAGDQYTYRLSDGGAGRVLSAGQSLTFAAVDLSAVVPSPVRRVRLGVVSEVTHTAAGVDFNVNVRPTGSSALTVGVIAARCRSQVTGVVATGAAEVVVECDTSQSIDYLLENTPATSGGASIDVRGFVFPG